MTSHPPANPTPMLRPLFALALSCATAVQAIEVRELPAPRPADTGESNLHTVPDGTVHLTYSGAGTVAGERALWLATLAPGAAAWTPARIIAHSPRLLENWADFASLIVASDGALWAQWLERGAEGEGYSGWVARSADQGATWSAPAPLGHEFVRLAPLSGGRVLAVWLESTRREHGGHAGHGVPRVPAPGEPAPAVMRLQARLLDPHGRSLGEWTVDPDVCTCCQTTIRALPGDRALVAYRGHTSEDIRDTRVAVFDGRGWSPPRLLHGDGWQIAACPVNGPAADARGEAVAVAWFTAAGGVARVQVKFSADAGATFGPAQAVDLGAPLGRVDLALLGDGSALVSWLERPGATAAAGIYVRRLAAGGAASAAQLIAPTTEARASGFPRLAVQPGDRVVLTYTEDTTPTRVRTVLLAHPPELASP